MVGFNLTDRFLQNENKNNMLFQFIDRLNWNKRWRICSSRVTHCNYRDRIMEEKLDLGFLMITHRLLFYTHKWVDGVGF